MQVVGADSRTQYYTLVHNDAYSNNAEVFKETQRRIPQEDYVTVVKGFIGSYPNAFFQIQEAELDDFVNSIEAMRGEDDYAKLKSRFGVRRNQASFWPVSDSIHASYQQQFPREAGLFDLNRYENR